MMRQPADSPAGVPKVVAPADELGLQAELSTGLQGLDPAVDGLDGLEDAVVLAGKIAHGVSGRGSPLGAVVLQVF